MDGSIVGIRTRLPSEAILIRVAVRKVVVLLSSRSDLRLK